MDMDVTTPVLRREQSRKEEIANSLSHGVGLVAALMATAFLITQAEQRSIAGFVVGASLFTASMVLLYLTSTLYHAFPGGKTKRARQIIEHSATFLLIAGTYTPFTLGVLRGTWGWTILGLVWGLAVVGVVLKALNGLFHPLISTGLYLLMGWLILIAIHPLVTTVPLEGLFWIGGVADKIRPLHLALVRKLLAPHAITAPSFGMRPKWRREERMNESSRFWKPAPASPSKAFDLQIAVRFLWTASMVMMMLVAFPDPVLAGPHCPGIHVQVLDIRNSKGTVACALFDSPQGFPTEYLRSATNIMVIKVRKLQARCDFEDMPPGKYALAVIHDENMNGKLDVNVLGIPKEGYGFSNDPKIGLHAPSFSDASFSYNGEDLEMTINLRY